MKYALSYFFIISNLVFLTNCSSHPEIKPYEPTYVKEYSAYENELSAEASSDPAFRDNTLAVNDDDDIEDSDVPTEFDDKIDMAETPKKAAVTITQSQPVVKKDAPAKEKASADRKPASNTKNGFYNLSSNCMMKSQPDAGSEDMGSASSGKKLWLDVHDNNWFKAYKKSGTVYISSSCVN